MSVSIFPDRIDLHFHFEHDNLDVVMQAMREQTCLLQQVLAVLNIQQQELTGMSQELDDLIAAVHANSDTEDAAVEAIGKLNDLIVAHQNDPAQLAALTQEVNQRKAALAAAIVATTPPPTPTPQPPPVVTDPSPAPVRTNPRLTAPRLADQ
jgi:hypothetical protein